MRSRNTIATISLSVLLAFGLISCTDDSSTGIDEESRATINGSVEEEAASGESSALARDVDGVTVTAARITSDGSYDLMSDTETETNASGEFSLEVDTEQANRIAIIAEHEADELRAVLTSNIENGQTYILKPVNFESTAEADIFAEIIAEGNGGMVKKSDAEIVVLSSTASEVHSNAAATGEFAAGLSSAAEARMEYVEDEVDGSADATLDEAFELMTEAQLQYEAEIASTSSQEDRDAALELLLHAYVDAWLEADLDESSVAKMIHIQQSALQNSFSSVSSEVRNDARASQSLLGAIAVDAAVRARAEAEDLSESTQSEIEEAGVQLMSEIRSSSGASAEIEAAFETYHDEVRSALENDSSVEASILVTIDTEINSATGAKAQFTSAISGITDALQLTDSYADFTANVHSEVETHSDVIGEIETEAMAELLVLINLYN